MLCICAWLWHLSKFATLTQLRWTLHLLPLFTTSTAPWWVWPQKRECDLIFVEKKYKSLLTESLTFQAGSRVIMFSYRSGLTATMFLVKQNEGQNPLSLSNIAAVVNVGNKLKSRHEVFSFLFCLKWESKNGISSLAWGISAFRISI